MAWEYSEKTKQLFLDAMNQRPGTHLGELPNADAVGEDGSIVCGDAMKLYFNVHKNENPLLDRISEIRYQTFGCTSAIASSEALCHIIESQNLTPIDALKITNQDIVDFLGGLPGQKIHCSVMGAQALEQAVKDWAQKRQIDLKQHVPSLNDHTQEDEGEVLCSCFNLTEPYLKRKIRELKLKTVEDVKNHTKAGGACGVCIDRPGGIRDLLVKIWGEENLPNSSPIEFNSQELQDRIMQVIEQKVRPSLKLHGGNINIIKIKDKKVYCELEGSCSHCAGAAMTLENIVSKQLRELVDPEITVINI